MEQLLPDYLKQLWHSVAHNQLTAEDFEIEQTRRLDQHRDAWKNALLLPGHEGLEESLLSELTVYFGCKDLSETRRQCIQAVARTRDEWERESSADRSDSVERFYDETQTYPYELMWWHTLREDTSPLAYVIALKFAQQHGCRNYIDFGAGVGSGGILFARNGFEVALADISSPLLRFSQWRFERRKLPVQVVDLKASALPKNSFDIVTAMDVFEHLVDPVNTIDQLFDALKQKGFLFGRFHAEFDEDRPQHIVQDFEPIFSRLNQIGFVQVWQDEWLWGHQAFQKP